MTLPPPLAAFVEHPGDSALVTDFDGTLAPIVDDPAAAAPIPDAVDALVFLATRLGLVAVVSGRPVSFLRERLAAGRVVLVGQYGFERLSGARVEIDPRVVPYFGVIAAAAEQAERRWPDLLVERKGEIAFTVHWRTTPANEPPAQDLAALAHEFGLVTQPGRMACELRPPVPIDKGTVFEDLAYEFRYRAFAGDDHGDLAAFAIEFADDDEEHPAVCIAVGSPEAPRELLDRADVIVEGPAGLAALLAELAAAVSAG